MAHGAQTEALCAHFEKARGCLPGPALGTLRESALQAFVRSGFPTRRDEAWKYTSLDRLARTDFDPLAAAVEVDTSPWRGFFVADAHRIVIVNGRFDTAASHIGGLPEGVRLAPLSAAVEDPDGLQPGTVDGAPLAALNTAFMREGLVLQLEDGAVLERPVQVMHVACGTGPDIALHSRSVVVAGEASRATVVETFVGSGSARSWTNSVTEIRVGREARLSHVKLQAEAPGAYHTALTETRLDRDAAYSAAVLATGAALSRNEIKVALDDAGASCDIRGGVLLRGRQHGDNTTEIDHRAGHADSNQIFRNVLDDRARSVFQGGVAVGAGAIGTNSQQSNRNLLLSRGARADSKPELRILADDVKCAHGATVGELDPNAMFYLVSRGVPPGEARNLLIHAFVAEVVEGAPEGSARDHLKQSVAQGMGGAAA